MVTKRQLAWVQQNHRPPLRARRVGETARKVLDSLCTSTAGHLSQLRRVLGLRTGRLFREHCTLGSLKNNVLTILVDNESLAHPIRLGWLCQLQELVAGQCRDFHVSDIRFQVGRSELTLVESEDNSEEPPGTGRH